MPRTPTVATPTVRQMAQFRQRVVKDARKRQNVTQTARLFRVSRPSVYRWLSRYDGTLDSLVDRSRRPKSHPAAHRPEEIHTVVRYFTHNRKLGLVCLWIKLRQKAGYTRSLSALYRLLRRRGLLAAPGRKPKHKSQPYDPILVPGERFQVDVKYVPKQCLVGALAGQRVYQYTAIDECTRWRYLAVYSELSTYNTVRFMKALQQAFPFEIQCVQTDNGAEFTSRLQGAREPSAFEHYLAEEGIRHKTIKVATPRHNGKVERSHRSDQERFYTDNRFFSLTYLKQQLKRYLYQSNNQPLSAHNWKSANHQLHNYVCSV